MDVDALTLPHMAHGEADCTVKVLNVRDGPSLQAKVIGSLWAGQRVIVWQVEGVWWRVETPTGLFGWAHSGSLKPVKELVRSVDRRQWTGDRGQGTGDRGQETDNWSLTPDS